MTRRLLALLLVVVAGAACQTASTPITTAASADSPPAFAAAIHVEGAIPYDAHRAIIDELAEDAAAAGVVLTFELSRRFTEGSLAAGDGFVASLAERGHAVGVHADLGYPAIRPAVFARRLAEHKALVEEALGAPVTSVSGVCSAAPWVEPAIEAGFTVITGTVEYCLMSTADAPSCPSPTECHDPVPAATTAPWRTSSSADWLAPDPDGGIWIVPLEHIRSVGATPPPAFVAGLAALDVRWTSVADLAR